MLCRTRNAQVKPVLMMLKEDTDPDVVHFADQAFHALF